MPPRVPSRHSSARTPTSASGRRDGPERAAAREPSPVTPSRPRLDLADHVIVAEFGRAHGVRGEIRLKSHTDDPLAVAEYGALLAADGRNFELRNARLAPGGDGRMLVVRLDGVEDRSAAEALNRLKLYLHRTQLPQLDDEDEFYLIDLVGLAVENTEGQILGSVLAVHDFGAGDVVEIAPLGLAGSPAAGDTEEERLQTVMVPFTHAFVPTVDIKAGRLVVASDPFAEDEAGDDSRSSDEPPSGDDEENDGAAAGSGRNAP